MTIKREVVESPLPQGEDETIVYTLTTTNWGSSPTSPSVAVFSKNNATGAWTDVTSTVMPTGSPSVNGDVISLPALTALTDGTLYRVETQFTISGNVFEAYAFIRAER